MELNSPRDYGLPHDEWYPNQQMAVEWAVGRKQHAIMEAPTGSGKTGVAAALSSQQKTLAVMRTKFLQQTNYEEGYDFIPLYGKGNYPCVHIDARADMMADECIFHDDGMTRCDYYRSCPYAMQRELARASSATAINYAYWFNVHSKWPPPSIMVCDEAHQLSEMTLNYAGITITEEQRRRHNLPTFPLISNTGAKALLSKSTPPRERSINWLEAARNVVAARYNKASREAAAGDLSARKDARRLELLGKNIRATIDALSEAEDGWYLKSGPGTMPGGKWGFVARPLTARYHFPQYFMAGNWRLVIMSATVGNPDVFASELGIKEFDFLSVPNAWPPETRPIRALDVPRLGRKSPDSAYQKQADQIANAIQSCDPSWSGIIHTTSIKEAGRIAERLHSRDLQDRIFVAERQPTNQMVEAWHKQLRKIPNSILVTWALWEGYDGRKERINIVAKTPYPFLGSKYEVQRQKFDGKFFLQRTAWSLEQGLGRTRRGQLDDYDTDDEENGMVAIADGGWKWIKSYLSKSTREAIV